MSLDGMTGLWRARYGAGATHPAAAGNPPRISPSMRKPSCAECGDARALGHPPCMDADRVAFVVGARPLGLAHWRNGVSLVLGKGGGAS